MTGLHPGISVWLVDLPAVTVVGCAQGEAPPGTSVGGLPSRRSTHSLLANQALRTIVASVMGLSPREVPLCHGRFGKPEVALPGAPHISLSHTTGLAAIVLADRPCGVDVELRRRSTDGVSVGRYFAEEERSLLSSSDRPNQDFFELWTRKEAVLKALGLGLHGGLDDFGTLGLDPAGPWDAARWNGWVPVRPWTNWWVRGIDVGPANAGAIALASGGAAVQVRRWGGGMAA